MRIDEQQKRGLNGELELMKTTSLRDANGGVGCVRGRRMDNKGR